MADNVFELFKEQPIFRAIIYGFIVGIILYVIIKLIFF
jgi:tetrahydromethanopterin S-methyltransferase subunit G